MADFDAELYLRLAGERMVLDRRGDDQRSAWSSPILDIASALVAIDGMTRDRAQVIAIDYDLALALRGGNRRMGRLFGQSAGVADPEGSPVELVRAVRCEATIEIPWGTVETHYALLSAEETTIAITATQAGGNGRPNTGAVMIGGGMPIGADLADDTGYRAQAHFSGGGGGNTFRGQLHAQPGLSVTTEWIELDGHRIELHDVDAPATVEIEQLPESSPAERHLWRLVAGSLGHGPASTDATSIEPVVATFVAAGAIEADDEALRQVRAVLAAVAGPGRSSADLPAHWASVLSRSSGPFHGSFHDEEDVRTLLVGVTPPPLDGVYLRIDAVVLAGRQLSARVVVSPGSALASWGPSIGGNEIAWWARDDLGNHYLGTVGSGGGGAELRHGEINFTPPLADRAKVIRLLPTASTERLAIEVPLTDQEDSP